MFQFFDYVDATGRNPFADWLRGLSVKARAKVNTRIRALETLPRSQWGDYTGAMVGPGWEGIYEIRIRYDRVQLRPLFFYGPGREQATLLMGAQEVGDEIEPRSARTTCQVRRREAEGGNHGVRHSFS